MHETPPACFDGFELQVAQRRLTCNGETVNLGARAFDLLAVLIAHRDRVMTKAELLDQVWPGLVVEENNLQVQISVLRKLLGSQSIDTIPGRGYQFVARVNDAQDRSAGSQRIRSHANAQPATSRPLTNLPGSLPRLYGRETELSALRALLDRHRVVTVVGAGGIGKSRLVQMMAHVQADHWPDGAWMIELAGLTDPLLLPGVVAQALGIQLSTQTGVSKELVVQIARQNLLLVLDNCEHLLDGVANLVQALAQDAPGVTLLLTSQTPLHLPIEQQYRLTPLAVPPEKSAFGARAYGAVALFEARVQAVDPRFALSDEDLTVAIDICQRLDGLPLAIELAAARVPVLGLRTVREKLNERFKLLVGASRANLRRHHALRAVIEWSHNLLNETEKKVFHRLGVFAGGFTMPLAQAVAGDAQMDEWAVLDHLSALIDKSLVVADQGQVPRYRLLESARAFALDQLTTHEMTELRKLHACAMLEFLERVDGANLDCEIRSHEFAAQVLPELDNLRTARSWAGSAAGDPQVVVAFAAYASSLVDYALECVDWLLPLQEPMKTQSLDPGVAARYWGALAATNMVGRVLRTDQVEAVGRALLLYRELGLPRRTVVCLVNLSRHLEAQHKDATAWAVLNEARALIRPDWPVEFHYRVLIRESTLTRSAGRFQEARASVLEAVRLGTSLCDWRLEAIARNNLVDLLWQVGPIEDAAFEARRLVEEFRAKSPADVDMAIVFANQIGILSEMGHMDEACATAREALPIMRRAGYVYIEEWLYFFWRRGQLDTAAVLLGASDAQRLRYGTSYQANEQRLVEQTRAALETQLEPHALAQLVAQGAALNDREWLPLIADALAQRSEECR